MAELVSPDITSMPGRPALSATSDTPGVPEPAPPPVAPPEPAPDPAPEPDPPPVDPPADPDPPAEPVAAKRPVAPRMAEMAAARRQAEEDARRNAEVAREQTENVKRLTALVEQLTAKPPEAVAPAAPRPNREQFADPDTYETALVEWAAGTAATTAATRAAEAMEQRLATERETAATTARETEAAREADAIKASWQERTAKAIETHPDFEEVAYSDGLAIPETMIPPLMEAENGPDVLYHLGQNPDEATRIAKLTPLQQAVEIGKLSGILSQPARPRTTKAPAPIEPVGSRNNAGPKSPDEMTTDEYVAHRMPKLQGDRKASMFGTRPN